MLQILYSVYYFLCYLHVIRMAVVCSRMSLICHSYVIRNVRMYSYVLACHLYVTRMLLYVTRIYSYVMVCHSYVLVCHPYLTRMYSYVIGMSLLCSRTWVYHESFIGSIAVMLLYDLQAKRSFFHSICLLH